MKKAFAIFLYAAYAIGLTLLITLGMNVSLFFQSTVSEIVNAKNITDVTMDIDTDGILLAGKAHYIKYTAHGSFRGDAGLQFESLDPEHLEVWGGGTLLASNSFEGERAELRLKITSKYDSDFEKIVTLTFEKGYPKVFSAAYALKSGEYNAKTVYVGIPIYVYPSIPQGQTYTVYDYDIVYDEEYFSFDKDTGELIPLKVTEDGKKLSFTVRYASGASAVSSEFEIAEAPEAATDFDEIRINGASADGFTESLRQTLLITLHKDGKRITTDFDIDLCGDPTAEINRAGRIRYDDAGEKDIRVTLPNGFTKTARITVTNDLMLPEITDTDIESEGIINMLDTDVTTYKFEFSKDATYTHLSIEYNDDMMKISATSRAFMITPKRTGSTSIKFIVDDGYQRLERSYDVVIEKNTDILAVISSNVSTFVSKFMGHLTLFAVLAFFSMNMFRFVYIKRKMVRFICYTLTALPIAAVTEIAQLYIPQRTGAFKDVLIDMAGFYLGTLVALLVFGAVRLLRRSKSSTVQ